MARKTAQEEENILNSVRSLIEKGEFDEAREIARQNSWKFWKIKFSIIFCINVLD